MFKIDSLYYTASARPVSTTHTSHRGSILSVTPSNHASQHDKPLVYYSALSNEISFTTSSVRWY